jgi:hypothetical protein
MPRISWSRVLVGGLLSGLVWTLLSIILLGLVGTNFVAALAEGRPAPRGQVQLFLFGSNLAAGVWATWLYAAIRAHYGAGPKTAAIAGIAWWLIVSMQSAKWVATGTVPIATAIAPGLATLPAILIAALAGGWCYENYTGRKSRVVSP